MNDDHGVEALANHLEKVPALHRVVRKGGATSERAAAWEIATGLADIRQSADKLFNEIVPRLLSTAPDSEEAEDLLSEVGEEYRHILYHIVTNEFFSYVVPPAESE